MAKPVYNNLSQPTADDPVMRYTSLAALVLMLTRNELPLLRIDMFRDPFEGSVPQSVIDQQLLIQGGNNALLMHHERQHQIRMIQTVYLDESGETPDPWKAIFVDVHATMARIRKARIKSTYASCWRCGAESEGMWRLYCGEGEGVALKTTFAKLEDSIKSTDVLAGKVRYGDYKTMPAFNEDFDHVMFKRKGFEFEKELRLLMTDDELFEKIKHNEMLESSAIRTIPWNVSESVDKILVSPYAEDWYFDAVISAVQTIDAGKTGLSQRVAWSELQEKPVF